MKPEPRAAQLEQVGAIVAFVALLGGFAVDIVTPRGHSDWAFYVLAVVLSIRVLHKNRIYLIALLATVLTAVGFFVSPVGGDLYASIYSRSFGTILIWAIVLATQSWRSADEKLVRLQKAVNGSGEIVFMTDTNGVITFANPAFTRTYGYTPEEVIGKTTPRILKSGHVSEEVYKEFWKSILDKRAVQKEFINKTKDGRLLAVEASASPILDAKGRILGFLGIQRDVTDRKRAEEELRRSEERFSLAFHASPQPIVISTFSDGVYIDVNEAYLRITSRTRAEVIGHSAVDLKFWKGSEDRQRFLCALQLGPVYDFETTFLTSSGEERTAYLSAGEIFVEGQRCLLTIMNDITEHVRAEEARRDSEARYRMLFERNLAGVCRASFDGGLFDCNDAYARIFGYESREEILSVPITSLWFSEAERNAYWDKLREHGYLSSFELRLRRKDGSPVWVVANDTFVHLDSRDVKEATMIDITERKRAEEELKRVNRALRTISECNQALVRATDETELLKNVCQILVDHGGYQMAFVGYIGQDDASSIRPVASAGYEEGYLERLQLTWADEERGRGPTGTAIRTGRPSIVRDTQTDPSFKPWRQEAARRGYVSNCALPLSAGNRKLGALSLYSADAEVFSPDEVELLTELADDLAFGITVLQDRALRKRADATIRASEEKFRNLTDSIPDIYFAVDNEHRITYWNKVAEALTGVAAKDILGKHGTDLFPEFLGTEPDQVLDESMSSGIPATIIHSYHLRGQDFVFEATVNPTQAGASVLARDITDRKRAEEALRASEDRYRDLVEHSRDLICTHDLRGRLLSVNKEPAKILGYSQFELLKIPMKELLVPEVRSHFDAYLERIKCQREDQGYLRLQTRDGKERTWEYHNTLRTEGVPEPIVRGLARDVTERLVAERELKKTQEQFLQAQKMEAMGRLAGGVAHDFNNLLTIINGYSQLLLEDESSEGLRRTQLKEILKAGERAASLTQQLLAFSRKQILEPRVIDLNDVIDGTEKMLRRLIGEDVELRIVHGERLGLVKADPSRIEQVILNLAVNSRDAMPHGGVFSIETTNVVLGEAQVRDRPEVAPGRYVMLAVSDSGTGMEQEMITHIFEPFFTTKAKGKGTGLGLSTVYGIVKQTGGTISVYSEVGHGTTFKIYLPEVEQSPGGDAREEEASISRGGEETILIVEDESAVRALAARVLRGYGYSVLESTSPEDAVRISAQHENVIDLLLTDVIMPGMSGRTVAEHLALSRPKLKVLYMSGYTDDAIVHHGVLEEGMAFLQKPFTPEALARKVREVLDSPVTD